MSPFKLKFWGVRGSYPVPGKDTIEIGGNTACTEIVAGEHSIILDAGTGIIKLGESMYEQHQKDGAPITATILFSHMHHDHNQGFPFFKPAYLGTSVLYLFGPRFFHEDIQGVLANAMLPPFFPVALNELNSARIIRSIDDSEIIIIGQATEGRPRAFNKYRDPEAKNPSPDDLVIDIMKGYAHPKGGIIFYRINYQGASVVYASDTEGYQWGDAKLIQFAKNCDLLIHDAQYTAAMYQGQISGVSKQGYGHSTPEMAVDVAKKAGVKKLILFHHDPDTNDAKMRAIEMGCQKIFPNALAAREGMEFEITGD